MAESLAEREAECELRLVGGFVHDFIELGLTDREKIIDKLHSRVRLISKEQIANIVKWALMPSKPKYVRRDGDKEYNPNIFYPAIQEHG